MSKVFVIGTAEYEFPEQGDNAAWGEEVTDWAEAVTDALSIVQQPNDILLTSATISNNVTSPTAVAGFLFDTAEVRSINSEFLIKRTTVSPANNLVESGFIEGNFTGTTWNYSIRRYGDDTGVTLTINNAGQVLYTSSNITGTSYVGSITFRAKVING